MATLSHIGDQNGRGSSGTVYSYCNGLLVVRDVHRTQPPRFVGSTRGGISAFSPGSALRLRRYLRECVAEYSVMVTLTYPCGYPSDGRTVKEHLRRFLQEYRRECYRSGCDERAWSAFWFLEFQGRGAPHFHIFATDGVRKEWVSQTWFRIVGSEDLRHLRAGTKIESIREGRRGIVSYAAKYAAKNEQKQVPEDYEHVGRFWGVSGLRALMAASCYVESRHAPDIAPHRVKLFDKVAELVRLKQASVVVRSQGTVVVFVKSVPGHVAVERIMNVLTSKSVAIGVSSYQEWLFQDAEVVV